MTLCVYHPNAHPKKLNMYACSLKQLKTSRQVVRPEVPGLVRPNS